MKRVLFFGAHPDDVTTGIGGMVVHHVKRGDTVKEAIFTKGTRCVLNWYIPEKKRARLRVKEEIAAESVLGVKDRVIMRFVDRKLYNTKPARDNALTIIENFKPDIIYCPDPEKNITFYAPDHLRAGQIVRDVVKGLKKKPELRYFMTFFVDHLKLIPAPDEHTVEQAMKAYKSQRFELSLYLVLRKAAMHVFGKKAGGKLAEGYRKAKF